MKSIKRFTQTFLSAALFVLLAACANLAQNNKPDSAPTPEKKTVIFKIPDGFMPAQMPPGKKGLSMLNAKAPAGMFVAYTPDGAKSEDFIAELREMYVAFFFGENNNAKLVWKETVLPAHQGVANETGKVFTAVAQDRELQIAAYTRTIAEGQDVVYGYFAMRDTTSKKNSAEFINEKGTGVKDFEKFWKTIGVAE